MSLDKIVRVFALQKTSVSPTERLVLICFAWNFQDETGRCDPTIATMEQQTSLARRTLLRTIATLETKGLLVVHREIGSKSTYDPVPGEPHE